ncbi:MAG: hypothetical protein K8W52_46845 [Deltaproteobacteria bacterium]|nr:hypothetical protein [Deltaproteobacteria bacterium]
MARSVPDRDLLATHHGELKSPWSPLDEGAVERELGRVVEGLATDLTIEVFAEFDHYGSGYASFVDAWFGCRDLSSRGSGDKHVIGLVVLLSRLAPCYCFLEGQRWWNANRGTSTSYVPSFRGVDALVTDEVIRLATRVEEWLGRQGYVRLGSQALGRLLPADVAVPTILGDGVYRAFDALFHWDD